MHTLVLVQKHPGGDKTAVAYKPCEEQGTAMIMLLFIFSAVQAGSLSRAFPMLPFPVANEKLGFL